MEENFLKEKLNEELSKQIEDFVGLLLPPVKEQFYVGLRTAYGVSDPKDLDIKQKMEVLEYFRSMLEMLEQKGQEAK